MKNEMFISIKLLFSHFTIEHRNIYGNIYTILRKYLMCYGYVYFCMPRVLQLQVSNHFVVQRYKLQMVKDSEKFKRNLY